MADVYNRVFLHLVWATYDRAPTLVPEVRDVVYRELLAVGRRLGCPVQAVGGVADHVHVLLRFSTAVSVGELVQALKGASSRKVDQVFPGASFRWQGAYGVFPVPPARITRVAAYIENQRQHHAIGTLLTALETTIPHRPTHRITAAHPSAEADGRSP